MVAKMKEWGEGAKESIVLKIECAVLLVCWLMIFGHAAAAFVSIW